MLIQVLCRGNTRYMVGRDGRQTFTWLIFFTLELFYLPLFFPNFVGTIFSRCVIFTLLCVDVWIHLLFLLTFSLHHTTFFRFSLALLSSCSLDFSTFVVLLLNFSYFFALALCFAFFLLIHLFNLLFSSSCGRVATVCVCVRAGMLCVSFMKSFGITEEQSFFLSTIFIYSFTIRLSLFLG